MNKKFFTFLTGALFAAVAGVSAQPRTIGHNEVLRPVDVMSAPLATPSGYYNYSTDVSRLQTNLLYQLTDDNGKVLVQERELTTGRLTLRLVEPGAAAINTSLWTIEGADGTYVRGGYFNFKNQETGVNLIVNPANAVDAKGNVNYDATDDAATIVDGCLEDWSWYAYFDNGATPFGVDPVYAYYGANKDNVIVFKENRDGYLVAVTYASNVAGQNQVDNISDAVQLKPVLANPVVLDASAINTVVDFRADGTFTLKASVAPTTKSALVGKALKAYNYDSNVFPMTMSGNEMGYTQTDLTDFVYITNEEDEYLVVDTTFYPNNSKYLELSFWTSTALPVDYTDVYFGGLTPDAWNGRFLFKVSYFPSQDSLLIEPMNALSKNTNNGKWENAGWAFNSKNNDQDAIWRDATSKKNTSYGPVAIRLAYLTNEQSVVTAYNTEVSGSVGVPHPGTLQANFNFAGRTLTYLQRTTVETGLYFITNPSLGRSLVNNLSGQLMYDIEEQDQDFNHMPATMWVVEQIGCGDAATVTISNREYANVVFTGQLYKDKDGNIFFIDRSRYSGSYDATTGLFTVNSLYHRDDYSFTLVEDEVANTDPTHGYDFLDPDILPFTQYYMNYNLWENPDLFLNVTAQNNFMPTTGKSTSYQLEAVATTTFGATYDKTVLPLLERVAYRVKVSDENLIDNDKTYIALLSNGTYVPMHEDDINAGKGKMGLFYLKADQVTPGENGEIAYVLIDILDLDGAQHEGNGWQQAHVYDGTGYLSYETLKNNYKSRSSAFAIIVADRPLYRNLGETDQVVKIYLERGAAYEYIFEDSRNQTGLLGNTGVNYAGLTSEGVSQNLTENGTNTTALYTIYAKNSSEFMPQYLFAVDTAIVANGTWCDDHGYNPGCTHEVSYTGYLSGRFLINLTDSITDGINLLKDADKYKHQGYTRLGFVEGVYKIEKDGTEKFYIVTENTTLEELEKEYGVIEPKDFDDADKLVLKDMEGHNFYSFSLRLVEDDQTNFLIESYYPEVSHIGSFQGSWVQVVNGALVLAEFSTEIGNHDGTESLKQVINQAQLFRIEENVEEIPTSNDQISVGSEVKVIASEGKVTVLNAAGKKVIISNILGQAVANTTLTSDNVTVAAPKGIVIVSVEGENAVKAIIK